MQHHGGPHRPPASSCDDSYDCLSIQTACRTWLERVADERGTRAEAAAAALWYLRGKDSGGSLRSQRSKGRSLMLCLLARVDDPAGTLDCLFSSFPSLPSLVSPHLLSSRHPSSPITPLIPLSPYPSSHSDHLLIYSPRPLRPHTFVAASQPTTPTTSLAHASYSPILPALPKLLQPSPPPPPAPSSCSALPLLFKPRRSEHSRKVLSDRATQLQAIQLLTS